MHFSRGFYKVVVLSTKEKRNDQVDTNLNDAQNIWKLITCLINRACISTISKNQLITSRLIHENANTYQAIQINGVPGHLPSVASRWESFCSEKQRKGPSFAANIRVPEKYEGTYKTGTQVSN